MVRVPPAAAFVGCTLIWGTTWIAIKAGYGGMDPLWGAALRFLAASALLFPLSWWLRAPRPTGRRQWSVVAFVGVVLFGVDYGFIYWGEQFITSGLTAVLFATAPVFVVLFAPLVVPSERLTARHGVAIAVGLGGLLLVFRGELGAPRASAAGMMAIIVAAAAAAAANVVVRRWGTDLPASSMNAYAMGIGAFVLASAAAWRGEDLGAPATSAAWTALGHLVLLGSVLAFLLYWDLLAAWGPHRSSLIVLLTPIVALVTGLWAGERMEPSQWIGSLVVIAGVALALAPRGVLRPFRRARLESAE